MLFPVNLVDKLCFLCLSEAGLCWVVQMNLELLTLLPQLPLCWDYKNGMKHPASIFGLRGFYSKDKLGSDG